MLIVEYLGKDRKLYAAVMDLEKAYDRVDKKALWNVPNIYGVGWQLLEGIKAFYREVNGCVKVDGELSDSFAVGVGVRQGCIMSPWLFNPFTAKRSQRALACRPRGAKRSLRAPSYHP